MIKPEKDYQWTLKNFLDHKFFNYKSYCFYM